MVVRRTLMRGYTLIELLTVVGIIILLSATLLPSINRARDNQAFGGVPQELKAKLLEAQSYAVGPPTDNNGAIAYGIHIISNNPLSYQLVRMRKGAPEAYTSTTYTEKVLKFDSMSPADLSYIWFTIGDTVKVSCQIGANSPYPPCSSSLTQIRIPIYYASGSPTDVKTVTIDIQTGFVNVT